MKAIKLIFSSVVISLLIGYTACKKPVELIDDNGDINKADIDFLPAATYTNYAGIDIPNMAVSKTANADIRAFAQKVTADHGTAHIELKAFASERNFTVPTEPDSLTKARKQELAKYEGRAFDSVFIHMMVVIENNSVTLFEKQVANAGDEAIKTYATKYLPKIKDHYQTAQALSLKY